MLGASIVGNVSSSFFYLMHFPSNSNESFMSRLDCSRSPAQWVTSNLVRAALAVAIAFHILHRKSRNRFLLIRSAES